MQTTIAIELLLEQVKPIICRRITNIIPKWWGRGSSNNAFKAVKSFGCSPKANNAASAFRASAVRFYINFY